MKSRTIAAFVLLLGAVSLVRSTASQGTDFEVFWRAANHVLSGEPLYLLSRDGGMVFKYPPWIVPFFFPLGLLPVWLAKWAWGGIEVASLALVIAWLRLRAHVRAGTLFAMLLAYWGLWAVHALDGQIVLPMLAVALGFRGATLPRLTALATALSAKIFTVLPLVSLVLPGGILGRASLRRLAMAGLSTLALFAALSIPAVLAQPDRSPASLFLDWKTAATTTSAGLGEHLVRGSRNPGLPGYILRTLEVPGRESSTDVRLALVLALVLGVAWWRLSRALSDELKWVGWLALTPVVHPLPWWHLFIFTFPLAVIVVERSWLRPDRWARAAAVVGVFLIAAATQKLWGAAGTFFELHASKSWGTLICLAVLIRTEKPSISGTCKS